MRSRGEDERKKKREHKIVEPTPRGNRGSEREFGRTLKIQAFLEILLELIFSSNI
jgi:hypothetical protein